MPDVLLISTPFGALERPSLGLGLLHAGARRHGFSCSTRYLGFDLADRIGLSSYQWLSNTLPYEAFIGEWLFGEALHGRRPDADREFLEDVLIGYWHLPEDEVRAVAEARPICGAFIEEMADTIDWARFDVIGFTSTFHQNMASLALAKRVKLAAPEAVLCFGGANWEGPMGIALQESFDFVDVVFSGEADESFPAFLSSRRDGRGPDAIPGITYRDEDGSTVTGPDCAPLTELDNLPVPDFAPYFEALANSQSADQVSPTLLLEAARGCWWGAKSHCTFCGLNGNSMAFRSKSPDRLLDEIVELAHTWGIHTFSVVDNILDMKYFRTVLPRLAEAEDPFSFFWEVKANLSRAQVGMLARAGVSHVQPGIESMSNHVLDLMRKGTTRFRNVSLLKWCREYDVTPEWNLLYGFPGEREQDYQEMASLFLTITHLAPPSGQGSVRLDRFSPYHDDPGSFGMINVRPARAYHYLYPDLRERLDEICYYFDFDYADGHDPQACAAPALAAVDSWRRGHASSGLWVVEDSEEGVTIIDERTSNRRTASLDGWKAAVYLACDRARTREELDQLESLADVPAEQVDQFLARCVTTGLMITDGLGHLSLAVYRPPRIGTQESIRRIPVAASAVS